MTDFEGATPTAEPLSTAIDADPKSLPSGGGVVKPEAEPTLRETIAAEVKKEAAAAPVEGKEPPEEKPDKEAKAPDSEEKPKSERAPDGKFAAKPKAEDAESDSETKPEAKPEAGQEGEKEGKRHSEPPKSFLPDSKEVYRNVPRSVQRDIAIMERTHGEELERVKHVTERYESIRPFDELARSNGRDLRESLTRMAQVEDMMQANPIAGLDAILREIGPRKQDGGYVSLYEVAQHIVNSGPQGYQQMMAHAQQSQQQRVDPQVQAMQEQLFEAKTQLLAAQVIEPFKATHSRYDELQGSIASFLNSDMVSRSLSPAERLEAAYVMAERINPPSSHADDNDSGPAPERRAAESLSGVKSIRSAPGAVSDDMEPERGGSIRDTLLDEMRRAKRA